MRIAVIGGGLMGVALAYELAKNDVRVTLFERSDSLGGLAGRCVLPDGAVVDRFYHTILGSDRHLITLCEELDLASTLRFCDTGMAFFHEGAIYPMNDLLEFLRFPPLRWPDRLRLGLTIVYAQLLRDWRPLEDTSVEEWLCRLSGRRVVQNIWRPLLRAKFDGDFDEVPATYVWSRLVRQQSSRQTTGHGDRAGYLPGGYLALVEAMAGYIAEGGGEVRLAEGVRRVCIEEGRAVGIETGTGLHPFDAIVAALPMPELVRLLPEAPREYRDALSRLEYMSIVCPLLALDRPLTGVWTMNITDESIPFTGIIETTAYIDPQDVGGHHLVYLPKYTAASSIWMAMSDEEVAEVWLTNLARMFPAFDRRRIRHMVINRARYAEPIHRLGSAHLIPSLETPVDGLFCASACQVYPALTNGESVTRHARDAAARCLDTLRGRRLSAAAAIGVPEVGSP